MTEASYTEKGIIAWYLPYGNYGPTRLPERFVDSLLGIGYGTAWNYVQRVKTGQLVVSLEDAQ